VPLKPGDDCAEIVAAAPAGSTFLFAPGLYREQMIVARAGDTFVGDSANATAVVLSGARVIGAAAAEARGGGGLFAAPNRTETEGHLASQPCESGFPRCNYVQDLYLDGVPLLHVDSAVKVDPAQVGTWHFDYARHEITWGGGAAADPAAGHLIELAVTYAAVTSANTKAGPDMAPGVTVANLTVAMYAVPAQQGAIGGQFPGARWTVSNVLATLNHGVGAKVHDGGRLVSSRFVRNGQMGAGSSGYGGGRGADVAMVGCESAHNNYAGYGTGWEAGAGKFSSLDGCVLRDNFVHDNFGHGLWADVDGSNCAFAGGLLRWQIASSITTRSPLPRPSHSLLSATRHLL
jgi:hypothetical protein